MVSKLPSGIRSLDESRAAALPAGGGALLVLGAMLVAAMLGLLGGTPSETRIATGDDAELEVMLPRTLRSGMFFETTVNLTARRSLTDAIIAMDPALWQSITINTAMPQAGEEDFSQGKFRLHYGPLRPGERIHLKLDQQINPALFAGTEGRIAAFDGNRELVVLPINIRVLP